jgi:Leucine-rich repeat (LRR) protein
MKYALGAIAGTALLSLAKAKGGGRNEHILEEIEDIYELSPQKKAQITIIYLIRKNLTHLPDDIFDGFINLEWIDLRGNQLTELPQSIGNLTNLKILNFSNNKLTELPEWIGNLTKLERIGFSRNQLKELPQSIGNLNNLELIILDNNPWKKRVDPKTLFKMIQNGLHRNVIEEIINLNNSIPTKSNLRLR